MQYVCLIYLSPQADPRSNSDAQQVYAEYGKLAEDAMNRGIMRGGNELTDVSSATTVRIRDGKRLVTDGPFAETKEVLSGYFVFDCPSLDEAIEWASRIPGARYGSVEVRPAVDHQM
ncbi:MAG: YciI family protein [Vulcanimicrobiaceae bacterium]